MAPNVVTQACDAVVANDEPELQGPEAPSQGDLPVAIVDHGPGLGGLVAQVLRKHAERPDQGRPVRHVEAVTVEVGEHPLVWIEAVAVRQLDPRVKVAMLRAEGRRARHGAVDVEPQVFVTADPTDLGQRIHRIR